jgi:gliding motility-associated-like protein
VVICEDTVPPSPTPVSSLTTYNAFSPNGDGVNDFYLTEGQNIKDYRLQIFNRWGNLLFETTDTTTGWDGKYKGGEVPEGTYYYLVEAVGEDNKEYLLKGFLMLNR